jgi:hypothetical protein
MKLMGWSTASMATVYQHIDEELIVGIADDVGGGVLDPEEVSG